MSSKKGVLAYNKILIIILIILAFIAAFMLFSRADVSSTLKNLLPDFGTKDYPGINEVGEPIKLDVSEEDLYKGCDIVAIVRGDSIYLRNSGGNYEPTSLRFEYDKDFGTHAITTEYGAEVGAILPNGVLGIRNDYNNRDDFRINFRKLKSPPLYSNLKKLYKTEFRKYDSGMVFCEVGGRVVEIEGDILPEDYSFTLGGWRVSIGNIMDLVTIDFDNFGFFEVVVLPNGKRTYMLRYDSGFLENKGNAIYEKKILDDDLRIIKDLSASTKDNELAKKLKEIYLRYPFSFDLKWKDPNFKNFNMLLYGVEDLGGDYSESLEEDTGA